MIGKAGLSGEVRRTLEGQLDLKELVKIKFIAFKEQRKELTVELVQASRSQLVMRVGNVAVLYRPHADPARRKFQD
jgi:RNA-binding protein